MKSRKTTEAETKRVLRYCELVVLFIISIMVNFNLSITLLCSMPLLIPIILGAKDKNFWFFEENVKQSKELAKSKFSA